MSYQEELKELGLLESFDPAVFLGDSSFPQPCCDLVLALALAYNDLRDIFLARVLLQEVAPDDRTTPTKEAALSNGLTISLIRIHTGVIHELVQLLGSSRSVIAKLPFQRVIRQLSKQAKESWAALVAASEDRKHNSPLGKALLLYRNKVAFHYDRKEIRRGYEQRFGPDSTNDPTPYVSRGPAMKNRRFYFADAAAEAYLMNRVTEPEVELFLRGGGDLIHDVNVALYEIVTCFIAARGSGWRGGSA